MNSKAKFISRNPRGINSYWIIGYVERNETLYKEAFNYFLEKIRNATLERAVEKTKKKFDAVEIEFEESDELRSYKLKQVKIWIVAKSEELS